MKHTIRTFALALLAGGLSPAVEASTVTLADPQAGGIGYEYTVTMSGADTATFSNHVGAWSWQDESVPADPVGWTHTSNWVAFNLTATSVFTIKLERDATVPWPSSSDANRLASVAAMYPSYTIWKNWDNDGSESHSYNNDGALTWAEDLTYVTAFVQGGPLPYYSNSSLETIERTYVLPAGQYTIAIGSFAPATHANTDRQGYKATFTTTQNLPFGVTGESYFTKDTRKPLQVDATKGLRANDTGLDTADTIEIVTQGTKGTVTTQPDGSFSYVPGPYFGIAGMDVFTYRYLIDGDPTATTKTVTATVSSFAAAYGTHAGHIAEEDSGEVVGLVKLDVTKTGTWTGTVQHLGKKFSLRGTLGVNGELIHKEVKGLPTEHWALSCHGDGDRHAHLHIHGLDGNIHYGAHPKRSPFTVENPPPSVGKHRVTLAVNTSTAGAPQAPGSGTLTINKNGTATFTGKLGDKTAFSSGTAVIPGSGIGPILPVFSDVYKKPIGKVFGQIEFGPTAESNAEGELTAFKPEQQTKPVSPGFEIEYGVTTTFP